MEDNNYTSQDLLDKASYVVHARERVRGIILRGAYWTPPLQAAMEVSGIYCVPDEVIIGANGQIDPSSAARAVVNEILAKRESAKSMS